MTASSFGKIAVGMACVLGTFINAHAGDYSPTVGDTNYNSRRNTTFVIKGRNSGTGTEWTSYQNFGTGSGDPVCYDGAATGYPSGAPKAAGSQPMTHCDFRGLGSTFWDMTGASTGGGFPVAAAYSAPACTRAESDEYWKHHLVDVGTLHNYNDKTANNMLPSHMGFDQFGYVATKARWATITNQWSSGVLNTTRAQEITIGQNAIVIANKTSIGAMRLRQYEFPTGITTRGAIADDVEFGTVRNTGGGFPVQYMTYAHWFDTTQLDPCPYTYDFHVDIKAGAGPLFLTLPAYQGNPEYIVHPQKSAWDGDPTDSNVDVIPRVYYSPCDPITGFTYNPPAWCGNYF